MSRKSKDKRREPNSGVKNTLDPRSSTLDTIFALAFGLFLGLCIWKFGNPVILDQKILPPTSPAEFLSDPWPTHWANWIFLPLVIAGAILICKKKPRRPTHQWLWLLPLSWLGWQLVSATTSVDPGLTGTTLCQFGGAVVCYLAGMFFFNQRRSRALLLVGVLVAFAFCLVRAVDQKFVEFPRSRQMLIEGDQTGWTNVPPETVTEFKRENVIIHTNGIDIVNPAVLAKFSKGRVMGTLVYPNALAGLILLLFPVALVLARSKNLRPVLRSVTVAITVLLGGIAFYGTGSKAGWLIAVVVGTLCLLRLGWSPRLKVTAIAVLAVIGLGVFAVRFHSYFANGATSIGARFDYWRAAAQITVAHPITGTGPGTFQHPYAQIKSPQAEMTRLTHDDYLEQFCDSGVLGGILYVIWIVSALAAAARKIWKDGEAEALALYLGLLGWFLQGLGEFSLYIPALAWTAFTLLGSLIGTGNEIDKKTASA